MLDGTALEAIRDDALWIVLIIVVGLLVLRFARAPIRRILRRVFEGQNQPGSTAKLSAADVQKRVETLSDVGMTIKVLGKVSAGEQWAATGELRRRLLAAFAENGIELPMRNLVVEQPAQ